MGILWGWALRRRALWGILATDAPAITKRLQTVRIQDANYEPGGREFESLRARQLAITQQAVIEASITAFCLNKITAGVLPDFPSHTRLPACGHGGKAYHGAA